MASAAVFFGEVLLAAVFVRLIIDPHMAIFGWIGLVTCLGLAAYQIRRIITTCPRALPRRRKMKHQDWRDPVYPRSPRPQPSRD